MISQEKLLDAHKATSASNDDTPAVYEWQPVIEKLIRDEQYAIFLMEQDQEGFGLRFNENKRRFRSNN